MNHLRQYLARIAAASISAFSLFVLAATNGITNGISTAAVPISLPTANERSVETIRERFPDGKVKIERDVTTDVAGNYVNHGQWRMWDSNGELVAEGRYDMGRREGRWMRRFHRDEAALLRDPPFDQFEAPFVAEATFQADQLHGEWTIADFRERKCSRVTLKHGKRNGPATLWQPDGAIYRDVNFRNGAPVGELRLRRDDGELESVATYVAGQQLVNKVVHFSGSQVKQMEAGCLVATTTEVAADDFWQLRFAEFRIHNEQVRHGSWKCWYSNAQQQAEGYFQYGREVGTFTWWHAHGQEAVKGNFVDGQPDGLWTWWYANGQKAVEGRYQMGQQMGVWSTWAEDGQLVQRVAVDSLHLADGGEDAQEWLTQQAVDASRAK